MRPLRLLPIALALLAAACGSATPQTLPPGHESDTDTVAELPEVEAEVEAPLEDEALEPDHADEAADAEDDAAEAEEGGGFCPAPMTPLPPATDPFAEYCGPLTRTPKPLRLDAQCESFQTFADIAMKPDVPKTGDLLGEPITTSVPVHLTAVDLYVSAAGKAKLRITKAYGASEPDIGTDGGNGNRVPPIDIEFAEGEAKTWKRFDLTPYNIYLHPRDRSWVVYEMVDGSPQLGVANCPNSRSTTYLLIDSIVKKNQAAGNAFTWTGFGAGPHLMMKIEAEQVCERPADAFYFNDATKFALKTDTMTFGRTAWADLDNDGWQDAIVHRLGSDANLIGVLHNDRHGSFLNVADASGLQGRYSAMAAIADLDGDGFLDVVLPTYIDDSVVATDPKRNFPTTVFKGHGDMTFDEVPNNGIGNREPTAAAALGDFDQDGDLDLFLGNWLVKYPNNPAVKDRFFKGNGDGTFTESTTAVGMGDQGPDNRACYGGLFLDYDNDGDQDLLVANYGYGRNFLWKNIGGRFVDVGESTVVAGDDISAEGGNYFGVDAGDFDNDGWLDLYEASIAHPRYQPWSDPGRLLHNLGDKGDFVKYESLGRERGIAYDEGELEPDFVDFDNDGDLDLFVSILYTGHYARLYRNDNGQFTDISAEAGIWLHNAANSAWADYDRDGDPDLLVGQNPEFGGHLRLYENKIGTKNHWIAFTLEGAAKNRSAIGARVTVESCGTSQIREVRAGKGHFSSQPGLPALFGLGQGTAISKVTVRWADGATESIAGASADHYFKIKQGNPTAVLDAPAP